MEELASLRDRYMRCRLERNKNLMLVSLPGQDITTSNENQFQDAMDRMYFLQRLRRGADNATALKEDHPRNKKLNTMNRLSLTSLRRAAQKVTTSNKNPFQNTMSFHQKLTRVADNAAPLKDDQPLTNTMGTMNKLTLVRWGRPAQKITTLNKNQFQKTMNFHQQPLLWNIDVYKILLNNLNNSED